MIAKNFRYYKGGEDCYEAVELDVIGIGETYITTCVVNVDLLMCGINSHPCGNGNDLSLNPEQQIKVLEFAQAERKKIADSYPVKTYEGWHESGLPTFEDYCSPGDEVDEAMVDYFMNCVPPVTLRSDCSQAGEAHDTRKDPETGQWHSTYTTFSRLSSSLWRFEGYCFKGQTVNRETEKKRIERRIEELRREAEKIG